jgi:hypothetical protein
MAFLIFMMFHPSWLTKLKCDRNSQDSAGKKINEENEK